MHLELSVRENSWIPRPVPGDAEVVGTGWDPGLPGDADAAHPDPAVLVPQGWL